ncbi:MAG: CHASE domain-containing protein [Verrucomicrobiae bacterium]
MNRPAGQAAIFFRGLGSRGIWWALSALLAGLAATAFVASQQKSEVDAANEREFGFVCTEIQSKIEERLHAHQQILRGGVAFFANNNGVTRAEWRDFAARQKIVGKLPGIQGFGFARLIPREQLARQTREIRDEGFPDYRVWPEGDRETYSSIFFLEPFSDRNLRAFGYDMLTEPVRRAAMERARDQDEVAISGKVTLVQEIGKDVQAGTLMFAPVYRSGMPSDTVAERCAALFGWVYSPYRMNDLMEGILGHWDSATNQRIHLEIFSGREASPESLLYNSQPSPGENPADEIRLVREIAADSSGGRWLLHFSESGGVDYGKVWIVTTSGAGLSLLLAGLVFSLIRTRAHARRIAGQLTEELTKTAVRLQAIIDSASQYVWELDKDGTFTYVSPQAANVLGRPIQQILGTKLFDLLPDEDRTVLPAILKEQAEKLEPFENLRHKALRPDGSVIHQKITGQPIVGKDGKVQGFVGMAADITEEERTRALLAHDRERIETFFEVAIDLLCIFDLDCRFVRVSRAWEDLTGLPRKAIEGTRFLDNVHPDDLAFTREEFAKVLTGAPLTGFVNRYRSGAGKWRHIEWRAKLIRGSVFAAARDVTETKAAEAALEQALAQERQTTQIKSRLVAMASHEFRTPLASIHLAADLLASHHDQMRKADIQRAIQTILDAADFLTGIVTDVLDLSSLGRDAQDEPLSEIPLAEFLRQIAAEFDSATPGRITFESNETPVICNGIPSLLKRAVSNLLNNATKYSPAGTPIVLRLQRDERSALVQVEDQGRGIPEEEIQQALNEPFFRGTNTVGIPGTGLGLSIVSESMQRMGGTLGYSPRPDGGSLFTLRLPLAPGSNA